MEQGIKKEKAFTLAEVLITLAIIGVVASLTIPTLINHFEEQATVSKVKKYYSVISEAVHQWESENGCVGDISLCLESYASFDCNNAFAGIANNLKIVDKSPRGVGLSAVSWLPETTTLMDGSTQTYGWQGVSKVNPYISCTYLFVDGTTMMVHLPDSNKISGYVFIDVNGKKLPNRIGKDTFPIGLGSYSGKYNDVNPYYPEDTSSDGDGGLCSTRKLSNNCNSDDGKSPTAYVLTHGKLPDLKSMFGK